MANHKFDLRHKETVHRITRRSKCWNPLKKSELRKDQIVRTLSFAGKFDRDPFYPIPAGQKKRGPGPVKHHRNPVFPVFLYSASESISRCLAWRICLISRRLRMPEQRIRLYPSMIRWIATIADLTGQAADPGLHRCKTRSPPFPACLCAGYRPWCRNGATGLHTGR